MTDVATVPSRREITPVIDAVPILDTSRFEHMQRIANVMARSSMIPKSLRTVGPRDNERDLPFEEVMANCFLVVNQAARWGMDPFAVVSCCAVVHGRLSYEGKLVAAVLDAKLGISLHHHFVGDATSESYRIYLSDVEFTPELIAKLKPGVSIPGVRLWDGSVAEWKTAGAGTPWTQKNYRRMLIYRGTRDWARVYESAVMLGVYTEDELMELADDVRARRATPVVSLTERLAAGKALAAPEGTGFSADHVHAETGAQRTAAGSTPPPASKGDEPEASDAGPVSTGSGEVQDRCESTSPPIADSSSAPPPPAAEDDAPASTVSPDQDAGNQSRSESGADDLTLEQKTLDHGVERTAGRPVDGRSSTATSERMDETAGETAPFKSPLPGGWPITYAAALRRAQKKESLEKYAAEYWKQYGGWAKHKTTPDGVQAKAVFDAFNDNFGDKDAIEACLRELI